MHFTPAPPTVSPPGPLSSLPPSLLLSRPRPSPSDRPASRPCLPAASPCPDASTLCPWSDPDVRQGLAGGHGPLPGRQREGTPSRSRVPWLPAQPCKLSGLQFSRPGLSWPWSGQCLVAAWPGAVGHSPLLSYKRQLLPGPREDAVQRRNKTWSRAVTG